MSDYEKAVARSAQATRVREAAFVELRSRGRLSCPELVEILRPTVGEVVERCSHLVLGYGDVWVALKELERVGAVTSERIYNARIWSARG